jgi:primosomal protein N'
MVGLRMIVALLVLACCYGYRFLTSRSTKGANYGTSQASNSHSSSALYAERSTFGSKLMADITEEELSDIFKEFNITNFDINKDPELAKWGPSKEFFELYGFQNNTEKYRRKTMDVKIDFYAKYTNPILPQYKTFIADLIAMTHIQTIDSRYKYDALHAFGICTQYYTIMKGYALQDEIDPIFNEMLIACKLDPVKIRDDAKVILGSGTPSVETFYNASIKKYGYTHLSERFNKGELPSIQLIDTKKQPAGTAILTPQLLAEIKKTIDDKKQVILFQNRRGYAAYLICETCGWIPHCKHCDVTLTYHKQKNLLSCHYCGATYPILNTCQACGKTSFKQKSFGTEQIEEKLNQALPGIIVARMDFDNVKGKNEHDQLIQQFEQRQIDVLVGTQMVVKGLDFENVDLVGIVDADSLLNFNQYRVNERAFQMMEQVSGRAGRKNSNGKVIIQVSQLQHPIVQLVQQHNYSGFYQFEIQNRKQFSYPPFSRLMNILFKHKENNIAEEAANHFLHSLTPNIQRTVLGPAQPLINRVRNKYIWELCMKISTQSGQLQIAKQQLLHYIRLIEVHPRYKSVQIIIDIDPN